MKPGKLTLLSLTFRTMLVVFMLLLVSLSLTASSIVVKSDASNTGAAVASISDPRLTSGDISGLTFTPVATTNEGSFTAVPPGAPAGTIVVQVPPDCGWYCGQNGFVMTTFTLPSKFFSISLTGAGNVDDWGYVFLNGTAISSQLDEFSNAAFSTNNGALFLSGLNTLVVSDSNAGGGPSAVAFFATITYSTTPEPGTMLLLGSGIVGIASAVRRKLSL